MAWFQNTGLKPKMMMGSSGPLILVVVLCMVTFFSIGSLLKSNQWVDHTHQVIQEAMKIEAHGRGARPTPSRPNSRRRCCTLLAADGSGR